MWIIAAIFSAVFAGLTAILAKCGIRKTNSDVATALRTIVVLVFSVLMVFIVDSQSTIAAISNKSWIFLVLSGFATGASWICYFKALSVGDVNKVAPIDKSSTILSVLLAIIFFNETNNFIVKLMGTALIGGGTYLMIEKKSTEKSFDKKSFAKKSEGRSWMVYAILSAVFAALTSVLAKVGISGVESNLGTAIQTAVVLIMVWVIVFAKGEQKQLNDIDKKELLFIGLSGLATGASWLCYYHAIQNGILSVVVPIDKMSILLTVLFSRIFLKEKLSGKAACGLGSMCVGTLMMTIWA